MEINRCFGCMAEVTEYPCVHCGYDPHKYRMPDYALRLGTILNGKYLVGKVLGQGGFGITYVGWDLALERKVAIKEYFPSGQVSRHPSTGSTLQWYGTEQAQAAQNSGRKMFLKEARKMSRVDNIMQVVRVRDLFQENDTAYIIMDFVEGETLKERLKKTGPMSWEESKKLFLPVMEAMEQVHEAGLIHRDLSPDNLMLEPGGNVKILDLGAAKDLNINSGASSMQVAKSGFSPVEQYTQKGGSGPWTDVYALAATIYYTLTGILPPAAVDRMEEDTLRWNLPQLAALPQNVTQALRNALMVSPKKRTQTMAQFGAQLRVEEKPEVRKIQFRPVLAAILAAVVAVSSLLGGAVGYWIGKQGNEISAETFWKMEKVPKTVAVGDVVTFGTYEQDGNTQKSNEAIEWLVLDVQDGKALLLSKYVLEVSPYGPATWEKSNVRSFLNDTFVKTAFSKGEQECLQWTEIDVNGNGNNTNDQVFLLSQEEAEKYFPEDGSRKCESTPYAQEKGITTADRCISWWLRDSPKGAMSVAWFVRPTGKYGTGYNMLNNLGVRPAIWVSLD